MPAAAADRQGRRPHGRSRFAERAVATSFAAEQKRTEVEVAAAHLDRALVRLHAAALRAGQLLPAVRGRGAIASAPSWRRPAPRAGPLATGQPLVAAPMQFDNLQNSTTFTASLTLPLSDYVLRLIPARAAAQAQLDGSRESLSAARRKTAYDARALYYDWVRAELEAAAATQNLELGRRAPRSTSRRWRRPTSASRRRRRARRGDGRVLRARARAGPEPRGVAARARRDRAARRTSVGTSSSARI